MASLKEKVGRLIKGTTDPEELRSRGAKIGKAVSIWTNKIDKAHAFLLEIGDNVTISDARILMHDASTRMPLGYTKVGKVIIGNNVYIGADAIVLPGVKIGNNVIIGAGTVITKNVEDNSVMAGNPAKRICSYDEFIERNQKRLAESAKMEKVPGEMSEAEKKEFSDRIGEGFGFEK